MTARTAFVTGFVGGIGASIFLDHACYGPTADGIQRCLMGLGPKNFFK